jgi:putative cell wall-binding protein
MQMVWIILSPNDHSTIPWLSEKSTLYLCQVQNYQLHLTQILLSILTTPIQLYDIEVSHIKTMEKKLKRRQGVEGKTISWREDKELKAKQEVEREDKELKSK